jgi:hypothetical protein
MTFDECYAAMGEMVKDGAWSIRVERWKNDTPEWTAWLADRKRHVEAPSASQLVQFVRIVVENPEEPVVA